MAEYDKHTIRCMRCGEMLAPRTKKPRRRASDVAFTLTADDYVVHACTETGLSPCWVWRWSGRHTGYPTTSHYGRRCGVGRVVLGIADGDPKVQAMHTCDNPPCVNPDHLLVGRAKDNTADSMAKGRYAHLRGTQKGQAKLSEADIENIRRRAANGESQRSIARSYGVSGPTIFKVKARQTWTHV